MEALEVLFQLNCCGDEAILPDPVYSAFTTIPPPTTYLISSCNNNQTYLVLKDEGNTANQTYLWHLEDHDATAMAKAGAATRGYPAL